MRASLSIASLSAITGFGALSFALLSSPSLAKFRARSPFTKSGFCLAKKLSKLEIYALKSSLAIKSFIALLSRNL